jgi:hypothetical protein
MLINKCFLFILGSVCRVKRFHLGGTYSADDEGVEMKVRKSLTQETENFYAAGFDALVKRRDKCINIGGGYVEKYMFFHIPISHVLGFIFICDLSTDSPSYY